MLLGFLKIRSLYFKLSPSYVLFDIDGEQHYYNFKTNSIHHKIVVEFVKGSFWEKYNGSY